MNDENTAIAPYDFGGSGGDGIGMVANPSVTNVRAVYMRFRKGMWEAGSERTPVANASEFILCGAAEGWTRLVKGEPVQRVPRQPDQRFPARSELGDNDPTQWPKFDNEPSDPWCLTNELLLTERETGRPTVFSTNTFTGREAVADLCRLTMYQRQQRGPQAKPIIAIGTGTATFRRGPVAIPKFTIVGWIDSQAEPEPSQLQNDLTEHLQERSVLSGAQKSTAPAPRQRRKTAPPASAPWEDDTDLDDQIPL